MLKNKILPSLLLAGASFLPAEAQTAYVPAPFKDFCGLMQEVCAPEGHKRRTWPVDTRIKYNARSLPENGDANPRLSASFFDTGDRQFNANLNMLDSLQVSQSEAGRTRTLYVTQQADGRYAGRMLTQSGNEVREENKAELDALVSADPNAFVPFIKRNFRPVHE